MSHIYECAYCNTRDVALLPGMLDPTCSVCEDILVRIPLCECGADADDLDGEECISCISDGIRSGETAIDCMSEQLAKRVLAHMRKTPEPRIPQLRIRQAS